MSGQGDAELVRRGYEAFNTPDIATLTDGLPLIQSPTLGSDMGALNPQDPGEARSRLADEILASWDVGLRSCLVGAGGRSGRTAGSAPASGHTAMTAH